MRSRRLGFIAARFVSPWLMWLALLIPFAQTAASVHAISHVAAEAQAHAGDALIAVAATAVDDASSASSSSSAPLVDHCPLCVFAATLGHAAPMALPAPWAAPALQHAAPQAAMLPTRVSASASAYRSRAPPSSFA